MEPESASVLVTDDDPVSRTLLSTLVEREGHRATQAENGREACEILESQPIDVLLCDIEMPELDGYGVLERIRQDPKLAGIPVIMISALDDIDGVVRCIELGADDYIPKPANRTLLRARINASLGRKRLQDVERERVRDLFARFVPEAVVDQVLADAGENLRLGGERRIASVLFSDLRGFTAWVESHSPDQVIDVLNRYLSTMSDVLLDHGGTLVSYMGDGIMAVFGAPVEHKHHADLAVSAAQAMVIDALPEFNDWVRGEGLGDGFEMGIGINTGPVMSGNVGSERRLEYAAVGDTTNTAARLEQMTKETGRTILFSDSTRSALGRIPGNLVQVGEVTPRGRQAPVVVWALPASEGVASAVLKRSL
jgi:adenylate cyclase